MATHDLRDLNWKNGANNHKFTSSGTNNDEIKIPNWAKLVTVQPVGQAIWFSYVGAEGVAPSSHAFPQAASSIIQYNPVQTRTDRSIFLASQAGTATIYLIFE